MAILEQHNLNKIKKSAWKDTERGELTPLARTGRPLSLASLTILTASSTVLGLYTFATSRQAGNPGPSKVLYGSKQLRGCWSQSETRGRKKTHLPTQTQPSSTLGRRQGIIFDSACPGIPQGGKKGTRRHLRAAEPDIYAQVQAQYDFKTSPPKRLRFIQSYESEG